MSQRTFRTAAIIVAATLAVVVGVALYALVRARSYPVEAHAGTGLQIEVEIPRNQSFPQIAEFYNYNRYLIVTADIDEGFGHSADSLRRPQAPLTFSHRSGVTPYTFL